MPWWVIGISAPGAATWTGVRTVQAPQRGQAFGGTLPSGYQVIAGPFATQADAQAAAPGGSAGTPGGLWFVVLSQPAGNQNALVTATVASFPTEAAFTKATAETAVKSGPNQNEFTTRAAAQAAADKYNGQPASQRNLGSVPGAANAPSGTGTGNTGFSLPGGITNPLNDLNSFFSTLTQASTWMRVGEVVLGLLLIAVGIAKMTGAVPIATKIASHL